MSAKTHGTVENTPYIDSFDLWGKDDLLWVYNTNPTKWYQYERGFDEIRLIDANNTVQLELPIKAINEMTEPQYFFICPYCGKSKRYLYSIRPYDLLCRECAGLNYKSQQQSDKDSIAIYEAGIEYAREKLGWVNEDCVPADFPYIVPARPKGMHEATYNRIMKKFRWYQRKYTQKFYEELGKVMAQVEKENRKHERY